MTLQEQNIARIKALGWTPAKSTAKWPCFEHVAATFKIWLGKNGAIRYGKLRGGALSVTNKERFWARLEQGFTPAPPAS